MDDQTIVSRAGDAASASRLPVGSATLSHGRILGPDYFMDLIYEKAEPVALKKPGIKVVVAAVEEGYGALRGALLSFSFEGSIRGGTKKGYGIIRNP